MDRSSTRRMLQRYAALFVAAGAIAAPVVVAAADYTLTAPAPSTVPVGTTGMVTIHVKVTPNNAAGTKAAPTGFMTVVRQGDSDPIWCYPDSGTLCYTGSLVNGGVDVHVYMSKLAATPGTLVLQLRDPSTKTPYSNALPVQVLASTTSAVSGSHVMNPGVVKTVPAPGTPMALHALTAAERNALPPSTTFAINGRVVSLGQLREAHKLRDSQIASAAADGRAARLALRSKHVLRAVPPPSTNSGTANVQILATATATPFPTQLLVGALTQTPVPQKASDLAHVPQDMAKFCKAAAATTCLYVPPGLYFHQGDGIVSYDPLIDQPTCAPLGGTWRSPPFDLSGKGADVCWFAYPATDVTSFVPTAATMFGYAFSDACNAGFSTVADPKGALSITYSDHADVDYFQVLTPQSCVGYAYLQ